MSENTYINIYRMLGKRTHANELLCLEHPTEALAISCATRLIEGHDDIPSYELVALAVPVVVDAERAVAQLERAASDNDDWF